MTQNFQLPIALAAVLTCAPHAMADSANSNVSVKIVAPIQITITSAFDAGKYKSSHNGSDNVFVVLDDDRVDTLGGGNGQYLSGAKVARFQISASPNSTMTATLSFTDFTPSGSGVSVTPNNNGYFTICLTGGVCGKPSISFTTDGAGQAPLFGRLPVDIASNATPGVYNGATATLSVVYQ